MDVILWEEIGKRVEGRRTGMGSRMRDKGMGWESGGDVKSDNKCLLLKLWVVGISILSPISVPMEDTIQYVKARVLIGYSLGEIGER